MISWVKLVVLLVWAGSAEAALVTKTVVARAFLYKLRAPGGQLGLVHTALAKLPV